MNLNSISNHYLGWQWPILPSSCLSDAGTLQGKAVPAPWGSRQHYQPLPWWNDDFHYWGIEKSSRSSLQKDLQRFNTTLTNEKTNKKHKLGRGMKKKTTKKFSQESTIHWQYVSIIYDQLWSLKTLSYMLTASPYILGISSFPSDLLQDLLSRN